MSLKLLLRLFILLSVKRVRKIAKSNY